MHGQRRILQAWLRDAHAMERATVDNLDRQLRRLRDYPELHGKLLEHLDRASVFGGRRWLSRHARRHCA